MRYQNHRYYLAAIATLLIHLQLAHGKAGQPNFSSNNRTVANNNSSCDISPLGCETAQKKPPPNIVSRTGGIVYKALSSAFSFADNNNNNNNDTEEHTLPVYESHHIVTTPSSFTTTSLRPKVTTSKRPANNSTSSNAPKPTPSGKTNSISTAKPPPVAPKASINLNSTTSDSTKRATSQNGTTAPTTKEPKSKVSELVNLLSMVLQSLVATNSSVQLSRSARLATDSERSADSNRLPSSSSAELIGKLARLTQQPQPNELTRLASQDVQLLCRLLNKAATAEEPSTTSQSLPTTTTTTTTTTAAPLVAANRSLLVENETDLSETQHASWLLESVFQYNDRFLTRQMARKEAERRLLDLFESETLTANTDESEPSVDKFNETSSSPLGNSRGYKLHLPPSQQAVTATNDSIFVGSQPAISLVYWLLEPIRLAASNQTVWRVFNLASANDLLARHEQAQVERHLQIGHLNPLLLLEGYQPNRKWWSPPSPSPTITTTTGGNDSRLPSSSDRPTRIIDDTLLPRPSQATDSWPGERLAAKLGFANLDFRDNLYLYLIVLLLILFVLALCFACPALLSPRASRSGNMRASSNPKQLAANIDPIQFRSGADNLAKGDGYTPSEPAIWRKLSNTTSSLVRDELESLRSQTGALSRRDPKQTGDNQQKWLTVDQEQIFEASSETTNTTRTLKRAAGTNSNQSVDRPTQTCVRKKTSKSIQTHQQVQEADAPIAFVSSSRLLDESLLFDNYQKTGSSDTLNKSELIMIKEKMVPISRVEGQSLTKRSPEPVYLNQDVMAAQQRYTKSDLAPSVGYIDAREQSAHSSRHLGGARASWSDGGGASLTASSRQQEFERQAKMRQVDWEPKTKARVDAIKAELGKLELRDQQQRQSNQPTATPAAIRRATDASGQTYKRFDTIT